MPNDPLLPGGVFDPIRWYRTSGWNHALAGRSREDNPVPLNSSPEHAAWNDGFDAFMQHRKQGSSK